MAKASIDSLATKRSLIDLEGHSEGDFGLGDEFSLSFVFEDILLVEYIDASSDGAGDTIVRGGIHILANSLNKSWRKARVVLVGPECKYAKVGDIVMFPNDKGATISNVDIDGYGTVKKGTFLTENRLFGICKSKT
tara:strand:+ start:867 stop:1274 length:408 start_codon:yes stop_codon:yes gene_type:complete